MSFFDFDPNALSENTPILPNGIYAARIINCGCTFGKTEQSTVNIGFVYKHNKTTKKRERTNELTIQANLNYGVCLTSKKAIRTLMRDEPYIFGGKLYLNIDPDTFGLSTQNPTLGAFLKALDIKNTDFISLSGWEYDPDIDVAEFCKKNFTPSENASSEMEKYLEEISSTVLSHPEAEKLVNACMFIRAILTEIGRVADNLDCRVKIVQEVDKNNPELKSNTIDLGNFSSPFCGILAYKPGCEEDLDS